ncbi:MAG: methylmalonyl-CoA mutase family protein [Deltaproteobacteria bacterium]|nr:methylmalonyl-CoA mutase family protein [Deltaproteobacteria bacterium]
MDQKFNFEYDRWKKVLAAHEKKHPPSRKRFSTLSDMEVPLMCTPQEIEGFDYVRDLGFPGEFPYTRGVHTNMYRGRMWTMRQFSGFGTAEDTNARFKMLLERGQQGLSVAFDMPTLMGLDSNSPLSKGEVGKCGVAVSTLADMEVLFDGIPVGEITTSMTINSPAPILLAMYVAVAEARGVPKEKIKGTLQNDILKEYIAQKEWIYPPKPSMRLVADTLEYCTKSLPNWNTISISGYHIREAGATAVQELAFTLADGIAYVQAGVDRGLDVDQFAPRLSYFWDVHNDFFEEIAKFRAGRRMWAHIMRDRFKAKDPKSWMLRTHAQTAGVSLTAQQPLNNIARVTIQGLAAVLGGTNSLHTNSMDETLSLPTESAVMVALRTQQIIAEESGVANMVDPLGGSYFVEWLTNKVEADAYAYIHKIDELGGMMVAIDKGYPQAEIANAAYHFQRQLESQDKVMVGINKHSVDEKSRGIDTLYIDRTAEDRQNKRIEQIKSRRDAKKVEASLNGLRKACEGTENTMPHILECVKAYCTVQEICDVMRKVFGIYRDPGMF